VTGIRFEYLFFPEQQKLIERRMRGLLDEFVSRFDAPEIDRYKNCL